MAAAASGNTLVQIGNSALFDSANSEDLSRGSMSGTGTTWTASFWVNRCLLGDTNARFMFTTASDAGLAFSNNSTADVLAWYGGSYVATTSVFRDTNGWYHIVVKNVAGTGTVYVNGVSVLSDLTVPTADATMAIGSYNNSSSYFDGYMAEWVFIDGTALQPTSFAEFDSTGTFWTPVESSTIKALTFGSNGFYLDNTTNAQTDASGNGNNFTNNNTVVTTTHTPTNINCLLSSLWKNNSSVLSNGNRTINEGPTGWQFNMATLGVSSGKWYWEVKAEALSDGEAMMTGIADASIDAQGTNSTGTGFYGYSSYGVTYSTSSASYGDTYGDDDIIGVQLNMDDGEIHFYKNNTIQNSGTAAFTGLTEVYYPMTAVYNLYHPVHRFAEDEWSYSAPTGYKALTTTNIADDVTLPEGTIDDHFRTILYTGNGSTQTITTTIRPDFIWTKNRTSSSGAVIVDSVRGPTKIVQTNSSGNEQTSSDSITSLGSSSYDLGADTGNGGFNDNGDSYVAWVAQLGGVPSATNSAGAGATPTANSVKIDGSNLGSALAGTIPVTKLSASTKFGMSVATFTGTGSNATIAHGLGAIPQMYWVKGLDGGDHFYVYHSGKASDAETDALLLNGTTAGFDDATLWNDTKPTSSVISLGSNTGVNQSGKKYVAVAFADSDFISIGNYKSNANVDGPFAPTSNLIAMRPKWVMIKDTGGASQWWMWDAKRSPNNLCTKVLYANLANAEDDSVNISLDMVNGGFKLRTSSNPNGSSGNNFVYLVFGQPIISENKTLLTSSPPSTELFSGTTVAIGGVVTIDGDYRIHTFLSSGTFTVIKAESGVTLDYLVIAGAGSAGAGGTNASGGGGGGAGGYRASWNNEASGGGGSSETGLTAAIQDYTITIGGGGAATSGANNGISGSDSVFGSITSLGGGFGAREGGGSGGTGGSGGGIAQNTTVAAGTTNQGFAGGAKTGGSGGSGGGGAGSAGGTAVVGNNGGAGGSGVASTITGSSVSRAGGGGGGSYLATGGSASAGAGRGGNSNETGISGTANTGGGGGGRGGQVSGTGGAGGSGIVIIRYRFK